MRRLIACLAVGLLGAISSAAEAQPPCPAPSNASTLRGTFDASFDATRRAAGRAPLRQNARLEAAAQAHACYLARTGAFGHKGAGGSNSMRRASAAGYPARITTEALAWGYPSPTKVLGLWAASPPHRRSMMHPRVTAYGLGIAMGKKGPVWVMLCAG